MSKAQEILENEWNSLSASNRETERHLWALLKKINHETYSSKWDQYKDIEEAARMVGHIKRDNTMMQRLTSIMTKVAKARD